MLQLKWNEFAPVTLVQVCQLVKFMIDHCQEILEQEPFSMFGGPPQRPDTAEVETGTQFILNFKLNIKTPCGNI